MRKFILLFTCTAIAAWASLSFAQTVKLSNEPVSGWDGPPILTDSIVKQALLQSPDVSDIPFRKMGESRFVNSAIGNGRERIASTNADPFSEKSCYGFEDRGVCFKYSHKVELILRDGSAGYCNPPFINFAVERPVLQLGDGIFNSNHGLLGYLDYEYDLDTLTVLSDNFFIAYGLATECEGAYIAVYDTYLRGFDFPLYRNIMHLGPGGFAKEMDLRLPKGDESRFMTPEAQEAIGNCNKPASEVMECFIQTFRADRSGQAPYRSMLDVAAAYGKDLTLAVKRYTQRRDHARVNGPNERDVLIALRIYLDKKKKIMSKQSGSCDRNYVGNSPERILRCAIWIGSQMSNEVGLQVESATVSDCQSVTHPSAHNPSWLCKYNSKLKSNVNNGMMDFLLEAQELESSAYGLFTFRGAKWEFDGAYDHCTEVPEGFECE